MDSSTEEGVDSAGYSMFLLHHPHHRCRLPLPPVSATVDCERQFLQLFKNVGHVAGPGRTSSGAVNEVDGPQRHQATALTCDEENSTSSNDSITTSRSHVKDISAVSRDTASDKLTRLQRPEHRQVCRQFMPAA